MRKRTAAGGILVVAVLVGVWLSGLFRGFGPGGGGGGGSGEGEGGGAVSHRAEFPVSADPPDTQPEPDSAVPGEPARVLDVLVDGEQYSVRMAIMGGAAWRPAGLDEIVRRAKDAQGNAQGLKVRIRRRSTSLPSAEQRLEEALLQSGLSSTEVHKVEDIAP